MIRVIHIFCDGGFGNRLNALFSGIAIAKLFDLEVKVYWPRNNWCQAAFNEIFTNKFDVSELSLPDVAGTLKNTFCLLHDQIGADTLQVPFHSAYSYTSTDDFSVRGLSTSQDIFYFPALIPPWLPMELVGGAIQVCQYQNAIREAVATFVGKTIGRPFHGLHLRRTDLNVGFTDKEVQEIVRQYSNEAIFVCSDDPIAEALAAVHANVHVREKRAYVGKRNADGEWTALTADDDGRLYHGNINRNAESVIEAVIDMLILAHSSIIGFSGSTFQNIARLYGTYAPIVPLAKPALEINYLSLSSACRMIQTGAMPLGDAVSHAAQLFSLGRRADAIQIEKTAIEYGRAKGISDVSLFLLHYNLGAHLINEGFPNEASLYLDNALDIIPNNSEAHALLAKLSQNIEIRASQRAKPTTARLSISNSDQRIINTYMQWHLGDNLIHLHFLRKLSEKYPEIKFQHALNPQYIGQCAEVIEDNPRISLTSLVRDKNPEGLNGWKGANDFIFSHQNKDQFGALYLDLFAKLSKEMGLSTPFKNTSDLLFDYPAILKKQTRGNYDVLLINSEPLSDQFKTYNENDFIELVHALKNKGLSVISSKKIEGIDCTLDTQCSVTDIANLSLRAKYFIAVCTGAMWPSMNVFNQNIHEFKIILNHQEIVDIGNKVTMCKESRLLKSIVLDRLPG